MKYILILCAIASAECEWGRLERADSLRTLKAWECAYAFPASEYRSILFNRLQCPAKVYYDRENKKHCKAETKYFFGLMR